MPLTRADYINQFRQDNPQLSSWTDDDILDAYAEQLADQLGQHPVLAEHAQNQRVANTTFLKEAKGAVGAGVDQMQAKLYDTAALAGRVLGSDTVRQFGEQGRDRNLAEASEYQPAVANFESIRTPEQFGLWLTNVVGSNAPQIAGTTAAASGAAALAPEATVGAGATGLTAALVRAGAALGLGAEGAAGLSAKALAAFGGASLAGFTQMQNYGELEKMGGKNVVPLAIANGLIGSALEAYGPASLIAKITATGVKKEAAEGVVRNLLLKTAPAPVVNAALNAARHGSTEMLTEIAQEAATVATEFISNRDNPDAVPTDEQIRSRLLNSGIGGFVLGGLSGAMLHGAGHEAPTQQSSGVNPQVAAPQVRASLDPTIPAVTEAERARAVAPAPVVAAPVAAPVVAPAAPVTTAAPALATPESQQKLISLGMSPAEAMSTPEADAQQIFARAQAEAAVNQQRAAVEQERQKQAAVEAEAQRQAQIAAAQEQAAAQQAQARRALDQQQVQSRAAQLRSQQAAARGLTGEENIRLKAGGILGALRSTPVSEPTPLAAQPGPAIFNLVNQARANADALQQTLMKPQPIVKISTPSTISPVVENVPSVENSPAPAAPATPVQPTAPVQQTPVAPVVPVHGLGGLGDIQVRRFIPVSEVSSPKAAGAGDTRNPTARFAVFQKPDGSYDVRALNSLGNVAVRENMAATPKTIAEAVSQTTGKSISPSMVRNILDGQNGTFAAQVKDEAVRQGYTGKGERVALEKFTQENGYKWVGTIEADKNAKMRHVQTLPAEVVDRAIYGERTAAPESAKTSAIPAPTAVQPVVTPAPVSPIEPAKATPSAQPVRTVLPPQQEIRPSDDKLAAHLDRLDPDQHKLTETELTEFTAKHLLGSKEEAARYFSLSPGERRAINNLTRQRVVEMIDASENGGETAHEYMTGRATNGPARPKTTATFERRASESYLADPAVTAENFNALAKEIAARGANITIGQATSAVKEGGTYSPSKSQIQLVLKSVVSPTRQDFISLLHEGIHAATEGAPEWVRSVLQDTFARIPGGEKAFYNNPDADPRVATGQNVANLPRDQFLMEQAVEHAALHGVDRTYAQGVIAAVWRSVKDAVLKAAMYLQKSLLGDENVSGRLAKEWVENVAAQLLAGDRTVFDGFLENFTPRPTYGTISRYVKGATGRVVRIDPRGGTPIAPFSGEMSTAAARYNVQAPVDAAKVALTQNGLLAKIDAAEDLRPLIGDELFRQPAQQASAQVEAAIRQSISNARIHSAVANQLRRTYNALFERAKQTTPQFTRDQIIAMRQRGESVADELTFENFMASHGVADPAKVRDESVNSLNAMLEQETGEKPENPVFDPEILIDGLTPTERQIAEREYLAEVSRHNAKAARRLSNSKQLIVALSDRAEQNRAEIQEITKHLGDYKATEQYAVRNIVSNLSELTQKVLPKSDRLSEQVGMTRAILEQLDEQSAERPNTTFTQRIVDELDVPNLPLGSIFKSLFDLEQARNFDLASEKPSTIRQHVLDEVTVNPSSELSRLIESGEGPNAKTRGTALLTAIISLAKKEAALTDTLRMQLSSAADRHARVVELRSILNETSEAKLAEIRQNVQQDLKRVGNRTIFNWLKKRDELLRDQRHLAAAQRNYELLRVSAPVLDQAQARASSRLEISHNWIFQPGAAIFNPTSPEQTSKEVFDNPHTLAVSRDKFTTSEQAREILRNQRAWLDARADKPEMQDEVYHTMQLQHQRLLEAAVDKQLALHAGLKNGAFHSLAEMLVRTGSAAGKLASRRLLGFEAIKRESHADDVRFGKRYENAAEAFYKAAKVAPDWAHEAMYNQALDYLGSERVLDQKAAFAELRRQFRENPLTERVVRDDNTWAKFTDWMIAVAENNRRATELSVKTGNRVLDDDITRLDPRTREMRAALRKPIERGIEGLTVSRGLNHQIKAVIASLRDREVVEGDGEASPFENAALKLRTDPQGLRDALNSLFSDGELRSVFLDPLITNQKATLPAPAGADDLKVTLNPAIAREAWSEAGGDILGFAERVYKQLGTDGSTEGLQSYQEQVVKFVESRLRALMRDIPKGEDQANTAPRGLPHVAMDARQGEDYPYQWLDYRQFSVEDNHAHTHTIAANAKFGRNLDGIRGDFAQIVSDLEKLKNQMPGTQEGRDALKRSDPKRYELLENATRQYAKYKSGALENFIRSEFEPSRGATGDMGLAMELYGTLVTGMLSGVKTALKDLASLTHPIQLEKSISPDTLSTVAQAHGYAAKYGLASVMNAVFGTDLLRNDPLIRLYESATGGDPARNLTYKDLLTGTRGKGNVFEKSNYGKVQRAFRIFRNTVANGRIGFNEGASGPALRWNLFPFTTQLQTYAGTSAYMRRTVDLATRAAEFYKAHPEQLGKSVTAKDLGITDSGGFNNLRATLADFGVSIEALGEKIARTENPKLENILDETTVQGIQAMVLDKILLESAPSTRPAFMRSSKFARANSALIGWSFGKTAALMDMVRDPERNANVQTVLRGALVMSLGLLPAAVAGSLLMDLYDKELTKKKSNLREFHSGMTASEAAQAVVERSVNMGAFGLPGEVVSQIVAPSDGAGTKALSVDQRIVWVNAVSQLAKSVSNFVAVGGSENANYATVYRGLFNSLGGSGVLQNVQLINGLTGGVDAPLFRDEANVTQRINVNNYLRAAGRETQMEVAMNGAQALPNPATPWVTQMVLAALANDPDQFQTAYAGAIKAAEAIPAAGTDPRKYVAQRFAERNPLKSVFKITPSIGEVQQLLAAMPEEGRAATTQAMGLLNTYGARLGVTPFFGSVGPRTSDLIAAQARALNVPRDSASIESIRQALAERRNGSE